MFWLDVVVSLSLPFVALGAGVLVWSWLLQRVPPSQRALERAEEMGPPPPPVSVVDAGGNARHEWAADLAQQRLRQGEPRW